MTQDSGQADTPFTELAALISGQVSTWAQSGEQSWAFAQRLAGLVLAFPRLFDADVEFRHSGRQVQYQATDLYETDD